MFHRGRLLDPFRMSDTNPKKTFSAGWLSKSICAYLCHHRESFADRCAVIEDGGCHTYSELLTESERVARRLLGTEPDACGVILFVSAGTDATLGILGAIQASRCPVVATSPQQLETIFARFPSAPVILRSSVLPLPDTVPTENGRQLIDLDDLPDTAPSDIEFPQPSPSSLAQAILTSGSTGEPKAVEHPHRAILNQIRNYSQYANLRPEDRIAVIAPLHSITGQSSLFGALLNGAAACFYSIERDGIDGFAQWLRECRISVLHATPTIYRRLAELLGESDDIFPELRIARIGGEPITAGDLEAIRSITSPDCLIYLGYGCSEMGTVTRLVVNHKASRSIDFDIGSPVGEPCENVAVTVCDENGCSLPEGEVGEVVVTSKYLSVGYWNDTEATERAYSTTQDGARSYRTGDLGVLLQGRLYLRGRADRQVKIRGHRVELDAVEAQLSSIPGFGSVAVEALQVDLNGSPPTTQLNAFLTPQLLELSDTRALRQAAAARVSPVIVPARFIVLDSMPQTKTGKVDREALRRIARDHESVAATAPESEMEAWLLSRWRTLLHRPDIGTTDDFFEVGGDSMAAVRMFHEIAEHTGAVLPVSTLLESPTVAELVQCLKKKDALASGLIVTLRASGGLPPLFLVHDIGGNVLNYRRLAQELGEDQPVFGIRSPALDRHSHGPASLPDSVEDLAALYIEEITRACGDRAVALAGLSFGGKVAFEIARQLHSANREVAFLGLLDTRLEMNDFTPGADRRQVSAGFHRLGYQVRRAIRVASNMVTGKAEDNYLRERVRKRRKKRTAGAAPTDPNDRGGAPGDSRDRLSPEQHAAAWHRRLGAKWQPQPSPVPIHYFAAQEPSLRGPFDNMANWRFLARGVLRIIPVHGDHISILQDPNVAGLAQAFSENSKEARRDTRSPLALH